MIPMMTRAATPPTTPKIPQFQANPARKKQRGRWDSPPTMAPVLLLDELRPLPLEAPVAVGPPDEVNVLSFFGNTSGSPTRSNNRQNPKCL